MDQRLSLVTLGVADLDRARAFYRSLGWRDATAPDEDVAFFQAGCMVVALWDRARLAEDSGVRDGGGWGGVTLAYNARSPEEVDAVVDEARGAVPPSPAIPARRSGAGTRESSSIPTGTPGRWPTTPGGTWTTTARCTSAHSTRPLRAADREQLPGVLVVTGDPGHDGR